MLVRLAARSLLMAGLVLASGQAFAEAAAFAVVLTAPRVEPVYASDIDGNAIQTGSVMRPVGYVDNIIILDRDALPNWSAGPSTRLLPKGNLKLGDVVGE